MFDDAEVEVFEEGGDAGEEAHALDVGGFGLIEEGLDEEAASPVSFVVRADDDGADLGEVLAVDVERGTADELTGAVFDDGEGVDVRADFRVTPRKQSAVVGEAVNELVDGAGIVQLRFTRAQGSRFELVFCCNEGNCE